MGIRAAVGNAPDHLESQILLCAYVELAMTPERADGSRTATLARFGALEVRLPECPSLDGSLAEVPPFWLEIYSYVTCSTVDATAASSSTKPNWPLLLSSLTRLAR